MVKPTKLLERLLQGNRSLTFRDLERLLRAPGFELDRTTGSHRQYVHSNVPRSFPVQPDGKDAKRYQIRELLELVEAYGLYIEE
ncbi:type II toxin-antitoxin system HicA family toxin [Sphingobium sp. AR-3-1]|uniref:Type II toxin-antitoxin system HicA family toxin n=1 Tax=Sphingobium psychrophilum TaxID=2728834 RepID=A0A7X9WVV8_9SPHN|nr:type II toxin-antitoxin system HicA family toxin [Sphingobium psychrophilum]NML10543.1 type II toxin-antitoxin system HicA family toxin [Sphingobium psychrophilum]